MSAVGPYPNGSKGTAQAEMKKERLRIKLNPRFLNKTGYLGTATYSAVELWLENCNAQFLIPRYLTFFLSFLSFLYSLGTHHLRFWATIDFLHVLLDHCYDRTLNPRPWTI